MEPVSHRTIQHPTIGFIKGIQKVPGVVQYLGVQYATLKDRFARGELRESYSSCQTDRKTLDATQLGPIPLTPANGCALEQGMIQNSLPFVESSPSDTECLTLNISVPDIKKTVMLPVLVFVHGGGFVTSSCVYPQYDLGKITQLSVDIGQPIVAVSVDYRLGIAGFLHSPAMERAGYKPNNGLHDQRLALRWIHHHIAGFGGDPSRVTFMGESAGGASGCVHLHSSNPLFHQMISMSGSSVIRPRPAALMEKAYRRVMDLLGIQDASPDHHVQQLLNVSLDDLRNKVGGQVPLGPVVDGDIIPKPTMYEDLADYSGVQHIFPGVAQCKRIMAGDCEMDGMAFDPHLAAREDILPKTLYGCLSTVLDPIDPKLAKKLTEAYSLQLKATSNTPKTTKSVLDFANDICFAFPARALARAWSRSPDTSAFLYHFKCPNPWDGKWKGHATHVQDIAFALQNYREALSLGQQLCAERFATDIITFVNGGQPWAEFQADTTEGFLVYNAQVEGALDESLLVTDRRQIANSREDVMDYIGGSDRLDRVMDVWQMLLVGVQ